MMTTGRRIKVIHKMADALARSIDLGANPIDLPPYPHWFARGPRGGIYLAVGGRTRSTGQSGDDFMRNEWSVLDESDDSRYVRPGTALYREAIEQLFPR